MASASTHTTQIDLGQAGCRDPLGAFVRQDSQHCIVLSWSEERGQLLQSVAANESWQAKVFGEVQEFLRSIFQLDVPLTIVDLPPRGNLTYAELREMATRTSSLNRSLLVVCGAKEDKDEELWARQIGAWAYLPGVTDSSGLKLVFAEARKALAKQTA